MVCFCFEQRKEVVTASIVLHQFGSSDSAAAYAAPAGFLYACPFYAENTTVHCQPLCSVHLQNLDWSAPQWSGFNCRSRAMRLRWFLEAWWWHRCRYWRYPHHDFPTELYSFAPRKFCKLFPPSTSFQVFEFQHISRILHLKISMWFCKVQNQWLGLNRISTEAHDHSSGTICNFILPTGNANL